MPKKTLILIGAGGECSHAINHAKKLGFHVVATDRNVEAAGASIADEFLPLCAYTPEQTVQGLLDWQAKGNKAHGVLCVAVDAPQTVAAVGKALGLTSISEETAHLATDKLAMKGRFKACGIPIPKYAAVRDVQDVCNAAQEFSLPLVIKPVDSRGARGVLRLTDDIDIDWAFELSKNESASGRVMVEQYLSGPQVSTEGLIINKTACIPGFADRNYEYLERFAPHIIENGGDMPSILPVHAQNALKELTGKAAIALGIKHGPVKGDMVWHNEKPYVIELAARHSGGYFVTHEIPWNTGIDLLGASMRLALGEEVSPEELIPKYQKGVCQRYFFPKVGKVTAIKGVEEAMAMDGIHYLEMRVNVGDVVEPVHSHPGRAGVIMSVGENRVDAQAKITQALKHIKIT